MNNIENNFPSRLLALLGTRSVAEFARFLDIPQPTLHRYLHGREPAVPFVITVCHRCGVSADWLLGLTDERTPPRGGTHHTATNSPGAVVGDGNSVSPDAAALADLQRRVAALERRR